MAYYRHTDCPNEPGIEWQDEWDCTCNDRCPACNAEIEPYRSEEVTRSASELRAAMQAVVDDYDDTGCEACGVISGTVFAALKDALGRTDLESSDPVRQVAEQVMYDYETEGCEGCGTISIATLVALKRLLST